MRRTDCNPSLSNVTSVKLSSVIHRKRVHRECVLLFGSTKQGTEIGKCRPFYSITEARAKTKYEEGESDADQKRILRILTLNYRC